MKKRHKTHLSFQEFQTGTTTRADMTEGILFSVLSDNGSCVTSTNNDGSALIDSFNCGV
jgi:hypothetical protein